MTIDELLNAKEGENYEFKSAVNKYDFGTLVKYGSFFVKHKVGVKRSRIGFRPCSRYSYDLTNLKQ